MRDELETIRLATSNGIKGDLTSISDFSSIDFSSEDLEPFMDPSGLHLVKANETRMLIQELQTDRNDGTEALLPHSLTYLLKY